jgi:hypothetical protein
LTDVAVVAVPGGGLGKVVGGSNGTLLVTVELEAAPELDVGDW